MEVITDFSEGSRFLESCDVPLQEFKIKPFSMVIFGGAGDLTQRKLIPTIYRIFLDGELPGDFAVIGVGMPLLSDLQYRNLMEEAVKTFDGTVFDDIRWKSFAERLFYVSGSFDDGDTYKDLQGRLGDLKGECRHSVIYYLAVPPKVTPVIVDKIGAHGLCKKSPLARIIVEKPFGSDKKSAIELNGILNSVFPEDQIYRIDHYLGKETVQNIIFFRFSNTIFERLWNSQYIDNVQITVAEDIGIEHRGSFYEQAGVVRDIVQNHMMQLIALVAMEPPIGFEADFIRDERVKAIRSIRPLRGEEIDLATVRGQYGEGRVGDQAVAGYREEEGVAPSSNTPTYMAAKFSIANWRWAGVPFYVRAGKRLSRRVTEICIQFRQPPLRLFGRACDRLEPNVLAISIQPEEKISLQYGVKYPHAPNKIFHVNSVFSYQESFSEKPRPAYGRLLVDCMKGDLTLFVRQDGVEAMWEVVDPLIERWRTEEPGGFPNYHAGSWGPAAADDLLSRDGRKWLTL